MPKDRRKTLRFRRAEYHGEARLRRGHSVPTLEDSLREAHSALRTISARRAKFDGSYVLEMRCVRRRQNAGTLLHLAAYTEEEEASVVPRPSPNDAEAPVGTAPPPRNSDYMDGDMMLLVAGNDVIVCANSLAEKRFENYCVAVFAQLELPPAQSMFHLRPVADADKLQIIEEQGVKEVVFDATAYEAEIEHAGERVQRATFVHRIGDGIMNALRTTFAEDPNLRDITARENLTAEVVFKFDQRKKGGEIGKQRIEEIAKLVLEEDPHGFKIKTLDNTLLGHDAVTMSKPVKVLADGKSVQRDAAFQELVAYYHELRDAGHTENR